MSDAGNRYGATAGNLNLPLELLRDVAKQLDPAELHTMTLVSRDIRDQILDIVFKKLSYTKHSIVRKIKGISQARDDVKNAVRILQLKSSALAIREGDDSNIIFRFLRSLPNLQILEYAQLGQLITSRELPRFFDSIRHAPLTELSLDTGMYSVVEGQPAEGIASLTKLSIAWKAGDSPDAPGSSIDHLYTLIRPSLSTLVELRINNSPEEAGKDLDLELLKEAGDTLRDFEYSMRNHDESVLDLIPKIFPHLTKLSLSWDLMDEYSLRWRDSHIRSLSRNKNLTDLQLSFDLEDVNNDPIRATEDYAWFIRCYKRRLEATKSLSDVMPLLRTCSWKQFWVSNRNTTMTHPFVIEEGANATRVVRGVKQAWMGANRQDWRTGNMVECKLEDLPGDIIGENDSKDEAEEDEAEGEVD